MTDKDKAHQIAWEHTKHYDPICCKQEWVEMGAREMAIWKNQQFWSQENIEEIIKTYKSFPDRSCPGELVKKTIEKLKTQE